MKAEKRSRKRNTKRRRNSKKKRSRKRIRNGKEDCKGRGIDNVIGRDTKRSGKRRNRKEDCKSRRSREGDREKRGRSRIGNS